MPRFTRSLVLAAAGLAVAAVAADPPAAGEKALQDQSTRFQEAKRRADEKAAKAFEAVVDKARTSRKVNEAARQDWIDKCVAAKSEYERTGRWPRDPGLGLEDDEWQYVLAQAKAYEPLAKEYTRQVKAAREAKDDGEVARLLAAKGKQADVAFPGRAGFAAGSKWSGLAVGAKGGRTTVDLRVTAVNNASFEGVVVVNPQLANHPIYEVSGTVEGNKLHFFKGRQVQGDGGRGSSSATCRPTGCSSSTRPAGC
ncbi:MAG: hypothetical protein K2X87_00275 [Gemmataceae bacterium]|nr:hypothetical protein [Gemmataceae bacterium]